MFRMIIIAIKKKNIFNILLWNVMLKEVWKHVEKKIASKGCWKNDSFQKLYQHNY